MENFAKLLKVEDGLTSLRADMPSLMSVEPSLLAAALLGSFSPVQPTPIGQDKAFHHQTFSKAPFFAHLWDKSLSNLFKFGMQDWTYTIIGELLPSLQESDDPCFLKSL